VKKIASTFLAFMVLFSTFSFTVEKHMCGDKVADYSFMGTVESCNTPSKTESNTALELKETSCCKDVTDFVEGTNSDLKVYKGKNIKIVLTAAALVYSYISVFEEFKEHNIPFKEYKTPLVTKDFSVLFATFLI
tara:strand:- start:51003 stop:51404 length:402 start_codon:yes stop_codon:yes gene_type:complete